MSAGVRKDDVDEPVDTFIELMGDIHLNLEVYASHQEADRRERARREIDRTLGRLANHLRENPDYYARLFSRFDDLSGGDLDDQDVEKIADGEIRMLKAYGITHPDLKNLRALYRAYKKASVPGASTAPRTFGGEEMEGMISFIQDLVEDAIAELDRSRGLERVPKKEAKKATLRKVALALGGAGLFGANLFAAEPWVRDVSQELGRFMFWNAVP